MSKIKEKFLELTSRTYPHKTEHALFDKMPQNLDMDEFGNLFIKIGESDVMFTSHLDTATSALTEITHVIDGNIIKTDGKSILGADDKAGVVIMLHMIENKIPGLYYFFLGEEVGCVGSKKVSEVHSKEKLPYINKVISFDRRGTDSVITFQASSRCCSDKFALELAKMLNDAEASFKYDKDPTGVYTDSAQFVKIYPECTNISVGYYSEHTFSERQDISHLEKLAEACLKVDWNSLPVERDPSVTEYSSYGYGYGYGYGGRDYYDEWDSYPSYSSRSASYQKPTEIIRFWDYEYGFVSSMEIEKSTGKLITIELSPNRILNEEMLIFKFLDEIELEYDSIRWDGKTLKVLYADTGYSVGRSTEVSRQELEEYIPDFDLSDIIEAVEEEESSNSDLDFHIKNKIDNNFVD